MIKQQLQYEIQIDYIDSKQFFIWANYVDYKGRRAPLQAWKKLMFCWHKESFYGTNFPEMNEGVLLSAWETLHYFSRYYNISLFEFQSSHRVEWLQKWAPVIYKEISLGRFSPDFEQWKEGQIGWKLLLESEEIECEDSLFMMSFVKKWISIAITEYIQNDIELRSIWANILEKFPLLSANKQGDSGISFHEDLWLERIGWKQDLTPFTIELRLTEPQDDVKTLDFGQNDKMSEFDNTVESFALADNAKIPAVDSDDEAFALADNAKIPAVDSDDEAFGLADNAKIPAVDSDDEAFALKSSVHDGHDTNDLTNTWTLDIILRDKKNPNFLINWNDDRALFLIPTEWYDHLGKIEKSKQIWFEIVPWLQLPVTSNELDLENYSLETTTDLQNKSDEDSLLPANDRLQKIIDEDSLLPANDRLQNKMVPRLTEGPANSSSHSRMIHSLREDEAWTFLTESSIQLAEAGVEILLPSWWQEIKALNPKLKIQLRSSVGSAQQSILGLQAIGDFDWKLATGNTELDETDFLKMVEQNRRLIKVNGRWMKLDPTFIKQVKEIMTKVKKEGLSFQDIMAQEWLKAEEIATNHSEERDNPLSQIQIELNKHMEKLLFHLHNVNSIPSIQIPDDLHGELRPYQKQGVEWLLFLRRFGFGACLADDMGLGKTVQMITYFLYVKEQEKPKMPALIICPTSVLGNWQKELERFSPSLQVYLHYGTSRKKDGDFQATIKNYDIVLSSYGLAQIDEDDMKNSMWSTICLDEAQNIKNTFTKQSKAIRSFKGKHHIALTGTPIENRLTELWSIFDYMNRGYLGSLTSFTKRYVAPIEKSNDEKKIKQVQQLVKPFLLRRTKKDESVSLNLPDKQEQKEYIPLTVEQASLYEQLIQDTFEKIEKLSGMERRGLILSMLLKLKQICNHPALYLKEDLLKGTFAAPSYKNGTLNDSHNVTLNDSHNGNLNDSHAFRTLTDDLLDSDVGVQSHKNDFSNISFVNRSHKTEKLMELVRNILDQGESCLIFTQYIGMGKMLQTLISEHFQETVHFLQGSLKKQERDNIIDSFQNGDQKILILSLKAGGTGLNLTAANHVIHYDRWWNPAVENQATDRAYRIGQKRFVHVHKLITTGTLEEKIDEMIEKKKSLSDDIISGENWITELSTDELRELFALRNDWSE